MDNPVHKILRLPTHQIDLNAGSELEPNLVTVPTIPGYQYYEIGDEFITVYGPAVNKRFPHIAFCHEVEPEVYLVIAEQSMIDQLDPFDQGQTVEQMGEDWPMWRVEGTEPDGKGGRQNVANKLIRFPGKAPDMSHASEQAPVILGGDVRVHRAWPSLHCTIRGYDFLAVVEPQRRQQIGG